MKFRLFLTAAFLLLGLSHLACPLGEAQSAAKAEMRPMEPYLTWQGDTSTTMTVNFQTADPLSTPTVDFDTQAEYDQNGVYGRAASGASRQIAGLADGRFIHSVELTNLEPGARYVFSIRGDSGETRHAFRTIPDSGAPLRFVTGGDMGTYELTRELMLHAAAQDPAFALIGGDLAYANGDLAEVAIWDAWLANCFDLMVTPDGALIPMVLAIGNHETNDLAGPPEAKAPFYFGFFPQGGKAYFARRFGPNMALFALDTGHVTPYAGAQTEWLAAALEEHKDAPRKIAVYHIPFYPSHRPFMNRDPALGREHWQPLFDAYDLDIAFENHDHAHKRTHALRGGECNPAGTVYLGDGCFGKDARAVGRHWYLAASSSTPHFWVAEVSAEGIEAYAVDRDGLIFDRLP